MNMKKLIKGLHFVIIGLSLSSCIAVKKTFETPDRYRNRCILSEKSFSVHDTLPKSEFLQNSLLKERYSMHSLLACNAAGLIPDLVELEKLRKQYQTDSSQEVFHSLETKKMAVLLNLTITQGEIESLAELIECEQDRTDDIKYYLSEESNKMQKQLTIRAIVVAGITAVVSGLLAANEDLGSGEVGTANDYIGAAGGLASVYLGIRAFQVNPKVKVESPNNLLPYLLLQKHQEKLPLSYEYFLKENGFFAGESNWANYLQSSFHGYLKSKYEKEEERQMAIDMLLQNQAEYDIDLLDIRGEILSELSSSLGLFQFYMNKLSREIIE
jgi:hypothetical protein